LKGSSLAFATLAMTSVIAVPLPLQPYDIVITPGGLGEVGPWLGQGDHPLVKPGQPLLVVSNPAIFKHYGQALVNSLTKQGYQVETQLLPAGERYKTLNSVQKLYDAAYRYHLERQSAMVALGGGVIGDMTGFAAATWLRGIGVVQVPTSLLAMVDAAIGGKTGVNHPQGKNLIGAFHQPRLVMIDPLVLRTLPPREWRAGLAEVIKYGVIWDRPLFEELESSPHLSRYGDLTDGQLLEILTHSCQAKAEVVCQDEKEGGLRAILNYGHTIGHGVESLMNYRGVNHGEAVAIGMVAAGHIAVNLGLWDAASAQRQTNLLQKVKLPTQLPEGIGVEDLLLSLRHDKKVKSGRVNFILPEQIGQVRISDQVDDALVRSVLTSMA
jgi:3-dehydroquinate synthase